MWFVGQSIFLVVKLMFLHIKCHCEANSMRRIFCVITYWYMRVIIYIDVNRLDNDIYFGCILCVTFCSLSNKLLVLNTHSLMLYTKLCIHKVDGLLLASLGTSSQLTVTKKKDYYRHHTVLAGTAFARRL